MRISDWSSDVCSSDLRAQRCRMMLRFRCFEAMLQGSTAVAPRSPAFQRLSSCARTARRPASVMQQLVNGGVARRGTLGVETQDVDERIARSLGLDSARGAVVTAVHAGSAAETARLAPGHVTAGAHGPRPHTPQN